MCISDDFVEFGNEFTLPGEVDLPPGYDWERSRIMNAHENHEDEDAIECLN